MHPTHGQRRLRHGRISQPSLIYLLTTTVEQRRPLLNQDHIANVIFSCLEWLEQHERLHVLAAVVMPDHVHVVTQLSHVSLPSLMHSFKTYTSRHINALLGITGTLWQAQYHDHAIRNEADIMTMIRYVLDNPVRAGLVVDFRQYPHWRCRYEI